MRIRALSVFEGVVYHCFAVDGTNPCRPVLEVDALIRPGDAHSGPLLVTVGDYKRMAGIEAAERCLPDLQKQGRIVRHMNVAHITFPMWTPVDP